MSRHAKSGGCPPQFGGCVPQSGGHAPQFGGGAPRAFTLVELLVVIAIIGVLVALILPAVQAVRESARRTTCEANLSHLVMAMHGYHESQGSLPPGVTDTQHPIESLPNGQHHGWSMYLLPQLDEMPAYKAIDWEASVYDAKNQPVVLARPEMFACPTSPPMGTQFSASDYAGCHHDVEAPIDSDNNGVLFLDSHLTLDEVTDGRAHTLFIAEKRTAPDDLNWLSGTRATLRNTSPLPAAFQPTNGSKPAAKADGANADGAKPADAAKPADTADAAAVDPAVADAQPAAADTQPDAAAVAPPAATGAQPPAANVEPGRRGRRGRGAVAAAPAPVTPQAPPPPSPTFVGPFGSFHSGNVLMAAFGDGAVHAISEEIDDLVFQRLGNRADGQLTPPASKW